MRIRDFTSLFFGLLSLILCILALIAGCNPSTLPSFSIVSFPFHAPNTSPGPTWMNGTEIFPPIFPLTPAEWGEGFLLWYFSVHFLSLCADFEGGTENAIYYPLGCQSRPPGWTFRTDDPWIVNFQRNDTVIAVAPAPLQVLHTAPAFAFLVLGIVALVAGLAAVGCEAGNWRSWRSWPSVAMGVFGFASCSLAISTGVLYHQVQSSTDTITADSGSGSIPNFLGLYTSAVVFFGVAFVVKIGDMLVLREKTRVRLRRRSEMGGDLMSGSASSLGSV